MAIASKKIIVTVTTTLTLPSNTDLNLEGKAVTLTLTDATVKGQRVLCGDAPGAGAGCCEVNITAGSAVIALAV